MLRLQIYIEEQEIELFKDESISLTQSIQDVRDISKVFTNYTKTFSVPASRTNNKVFKHFYNFNVDGYDPRYKKSSELHINYRLFKKGKIKLETAELRNNKPHTYKLTFYGDIINLKDTLDKDQLSVLTELNTASFDYSDANIKAYMTDGLEVTLGAETITNGIVFPLLTHTSNLGWKEDYTNYADGSYNIYFGNGSGSNGVPLTELKPAIKIHALVKAIESHYPSLTFSEDFFNSTNEPYYELYMWMHAKEGALFDEWVSYPVTFDTGTVTGDVADIGAPRGYFFPNVASSTTPRQMNIRITPSDTDDEYNIVVKKDGIEFKRYEGLTNVTINGTATTSFAPVFGIDTGDITVFIESKTANTFTTLITISQGFKDFNTANKKISFTGTSTAGATKTVDITTHLPRIKVIDFLTGLFKMWNLTAYQNTDGTIIIKTLDNYYNDSTTYWDITEHVDKKTNKVDTIIPYKRVNFSYEGTGTFLAKKHLELGKSNWGELSYEASADKRTEGQTYEVKVPFEHMKFQNIRNDTDGDFQNITFGRSVNENQDPYLGKPLLFYVNTILLSLGSLTDIAVYTQAEAKESVSQPYMPSNHLNSFCVYGNIPATTPFGAFTFDKQNLNFNAEMSELCLKPNYKTLFQTYYEDYVKDLFDDRKRLTTIKAYLPINITEKITLADKIILIDNAYKINKLTTNFENNLSTFELTNTLDTRSFATNIFNAVCDLTADNDKSLNDPDFKNITVDKGCFTSGFSIPALNLNQVSPQVANLPVQTTNSPVSVDAPQYNELIVAAAVEVITVVWNVEIAGKIDGTDKIMEHGVFISTSENDFKDSTGNYIYDIDDLKLVSNLKNYFSTNITKPYTGGSQSTPVDNNKGLYIGGLSATTKYYYKFYIRTVSPALASQYNVADTQSGVGEITTL